MIRNLSRTKRPKSKVVPIDQPESISSGPKVVTLDEVTNRIIIAIGGQRRMRPTNPGQMMVLAALPEGSRPAPAE